LVGFWPAGCAFGARALERTHGQYNEAYRQVDSEELLLNIVRLRYGDAPAEVEVAGIAAQYEVSASAKAEPFFNSQAARFTNPSVYKTFTSILPGGSLGGSNRPTFSLTPVHSAETIARYLHPITVDNIAFFTETSWPLSAIFRMWLEGMNGVPNAPSASGPTRSFPPEYAAFLRATELLQTIQDRGELTFHKVEEDVLSAAVVDRVSSEALVEARKAGFEYRPTADGKWQLAHKVRKLYLDLSPRALGSPEYQEAVRILNLTPGLTRYEVVQRTVGFIEQRPGAQPSTKLELVPRCLLQVAYYLAHGVEVPAEHLGSGVAKATLDLDGRVFDWHQVTDGLFTVKSACCKKPPPNANVAVRYRGYWFYIDDTDDKTKNNFLLLRPARQLDLGAGTEPRRNAGGPVLTLPVGR
jgi:hypothetical protein